MSIVASIKHAIARAAELMKSQHPHDSNAVYDEATEALEGF